MRYYADGPFEAWVRESSSLIESQYPEVKIYGLWIVTEILCTPKAALNVWTKKEKETVVGFTADAKGVVDVQADGAWHTDHEDSGWTYFNEEVRTQISGVKERVACSVTDSICCGGLTL